MAWDRDESKFFPVVEVTLMAFPLLIYSNNSFVLWTWNLSFRTYPVSPTTTMAPFPSSLAMSCFLLFSKSNSFPQ